MNSMTQTPANTASLPRQLLKPRDAAKLLGISERTLWTITKQGKLSAAKLGKSVRYREEDLKRYVESCLTIPSSG
ncbi:MAG TPA: helix-turn-helix domain-containing protein [Gemmatales bacterium]|nr:helix-turn-helix domain-containing protein [Gemmatales bacterium]